jgi:hypothetical protein
MSLDPQLPRPDEPPLEEPDPLGAGIDFTDPSSPLAPFYCQASHVAAAGLLALVFTFASFIPLWHTDIWGHLKFGQWMVEHGRLPRREPFCALADGQAPGLHAYWLVQSSLYLLYHTGELLAGGDAQQRMAGGVEALRTVLALVLLARCAVLLVAFRRLSGSLPLACLLLAAMLLASVGHVTVLRPQAIAELLFALLLLALSRPIPSRLAVVLVPLLLVLWANMHGSFPAGLMLLGGFLAGRAVSACWVGRMRGALTDGGVRRLALALALSLAGIALLNPHGPGIYLRTVAMGRHPNVQMMDEWQPLAAHFNGALGYLYGGMLVLLLLAYFLGRRACTPAHLIVLVGFAVGPLLHLRMMVWWYMVVPWLLCAWWPAVRETLAPEAVEGGGEPSLRKTILALGLACLLVSWSAPFRWLTSGSPGPLARILYAGTPWRVAEQLRDPQAEALPALRRELARHYPGGRFAGVVFASETQGDYLVWALPPEVPVFLYTHVHLFPPEVWAQCAVVKVAAPAWRAVLDHHYVNLVVMEPDMYPDLRTRLLADRDWEVVLDETGLQEKPDPRSRLLVALRKVPLVVAGQGRQARMQAAR